MHQLLQINTCHPSITVLHVWDEIMIDVTLWADLRLTRRDGMGGKRGVRGEGVGGDGEISLGQTVIGGEREEEGKHVMEEKKEERERKERESRGEGKREGDT